MDRAADVFATPGPLTDPGRAAPSLDRLPTDIGALCAIVQGLLVHVFWAERYGTVVTDERAEALQHRSAELKLARILEFDPRPLTEPRSPDCRLVGNCRDFTLLLVTLLRHRGVPARARCGFGTYFIPGHFEDHWVAEYWDAGRAAWVLVDAQLDALQREALSIDFDPLDVPRDRFLVAGKGWQLCRAGAANPDDFGIGEMHGLWFVRGDLIRDVAALQKIETLPWDCWGLVDGMDDDLGPEAMDVLDRLAALTAPADPDVSALATLYASTPGLVVPAEMAR